MLPGLPQRVVVGEHLPHEADLLVTARPPPRAPQDLEGRLRGLALGALIGGVNGQGASLDFMEEVCAMASEMVELALRFTPDPILPCPLVLC